MSDPAQENHPGNPPREYPASEHGDIDDTSVDQGLKDAVAGGPLTDGADQAGPGAGRTTGKDKSHGES
jgi:hypothetical protein